MSVLLVEKPFNRTRSHTLASLDNGAAACPTVSAEVETTNYNSDRFVTEEGHSDHHSDDHIAGQTATANDRMLRKRQTVFIHSVGRGSAKIFVQGDIRGWSQKMSKSLKSGMRKRFPAVEPI